MAAKSEMRSRGRLEKQAERGRTEMVEQQRRRLSLIARTRQGGYGPVCSGTVFSSPAPESDCMPKVEGMQLKSACDLPNAARPTSRDLRCISCMAAGCMEDVMQHGELRTESDA